MTVQDVDVAQKAWEKNCCAESENYLEKTKYSGQGSSVNHLRVNEVTHGGVSDICIFCVNKNPFFLALIPKIYILAINYLANHTVPEIFKAIKDSYH